MDVNRGNTDQLIRLLAESATDHAVMLLDTDGVIRWWSPGAEHILGLSPHEASGVHFSRLFTPEDVEKGLPENEIAIARTNAPAEDDRWLVRHDGSKFWATGALVPLRDHEGRLLGFGKILRNRTDLREQIETLRNQAESLYRINRRKDEFLSTLSHELRNPLAPISTAVAVMRQVLAGDARAAPLLDTVDRQVRNLKRLVDDLMDHAGISAGKIELRRDRHSFQDLIHRAVEVARPNIQERRHRLEVLLPVGPILVHADADRMIQVFVNLLNNAAKYTDQGGTIWVKLTTEGDEAVAHVQDTGIGLPAEMLPRIFDLFTQVESSRSQAQGGLGIGLSLVKKLVALHGGSVQARSEGPGKGSVFSVRLPLLLEEQPDSAEGP
jgi:PAS domain S-box-containing protein